MKKRLIITALVLLMFAVSSITAAASGDISVYLNGVRMNFSEAPYMKNDRVMVPMRDIFEKLGADVVWNDGTQSVETQKGGVSAVIVIGSERMNVNGGDIKLDVPAEIKNDRTFVPLRAVSEMFGCEVRWIDSENRVNILYSEFACYAEFDDTADFGACFETSPISAVYSEEINGYIYSYDINSVGADCGEKYGSILKNMGFLCAYGNGYTVYTKDNTTVLAGMMSNTFRVVVYRD